jgi:hypothetical protein
MGFNILDFLNRNCLSPEQSTLTTRHNIEVNRGARFAPSAATNDSFLVVGQFQHKRKAAQKLSQPIWNNSVDGNKLQH